MHTTLGISAAANYDRGANAQGDAYGASRVQPSESILRILDGQLKRLEEAVLSLDTKLQPLDCTRPQPATAEAPPKPEPGYDTSSRFMNALEDRARQIGRLADRLAQIDARTEL